MGWKSRWKSLLTLWDLLFQNQVIAGWKSPWISLSSHYFITSILIAYLKVIFLSILGSHKFGIWASMFLIIIFGSQMWYFYLFWGGTNNLEYCICVEIVTYLFFILKIAYSLRFSPCYLNVDLIIYCMSPEFHFNHGCSWLRLGILRFRLLLSCDDMDPAMKYYYKHSQTAEKISLLKLEIQVVFHDHILSFHT